MLEMVGAVLLTVRVKLVEATPELASVTVIVTLLDPDRIGVRVTVLLVPDPPKTIPDTGSTDVLDEAADKVRLDEVVSTSPRVRAIAEVATP